MPKTTLNTIANDIGYIKRDIKGLKADMKCVNEIKTDLAVTKDRQRFWNVGLAILNVSIGALVTAFRK